jgi:hypothetical protein
MIQSYPIHPEVFAQLYEQWTTIDGFQRTRGVSDRATAIRVGWYARAGHATAVKRTTVGTLPADSAHELNQKCVERPRAAPVVVLAPNHELVGQRARLRVAGADDCPHSHWLICPGGQTGERRALQEAAGITHDLPGVRASFDRAEAQAIVSQSIIRNLRPNRSVTTLFHWMDMYV